MKRENKTMVGVAAVACAACCAGPIIAFVTALGLGTILGTVMFGIVGLLVGMAAIALVLLRRRRRQIRSAMPTDVAVPVDAPTVRSSR